MESIKWIWNKEARNKNDDLVEVDDFNLNSAESVREFHKSFEEYSETPLVQLKNLSNYLGISEILVKDESYRFELNAFKVLGGSFAIGRLLTERLGLSLEDTTFEKLQSKEVKEKLGEITFATATDGNHGKGIAWAAQRLGHKSVVYMPKGSSNHRLESIQNSGADASITDMNYDDTVRYAFENAKKYGWEIMQDTALGTYIDVPKWIMQGYTTIMLEVLDQMEELLINKPSHVILQAGVGSFAGAIQAFLTSIYGEDRPITIIVEPNKADVMYQSIKNNSITPVTGDLDTIMAGLACGEPNIMAWDILKEYTDYFISCPDYIAANGMRILGNPLNGDTRVIAGESGAVSTGILYSLCTDPNYKGLKEALKIDKDSKVLVINTEGDTDPENYINITWCGKHPNP